MLKLSKRLNLCDSLALCLTLSISFGENLPPQNNASVKNQSFKKENLAHKFLMRAYERDEKFSVSSIKTIKILELKDGFEAHFIRLNLKFKPLNKIIEKNDVLFIKGEIFTTDIINLKTKTSIRDELLGEKIGITYERLNDENNQNCN